MSTPAIHRRGDVTVIEMGPTYDPLDEPTLNDARDRLLEQADRADPPHVIIDLARTEFAGSSFIEIIFRAYKRVGERGGRLILCSVQPFCAKVFRATRLDEIIDIFNDQDAALAAFEP